MRRGATAGKVGQPCQAAAAAHLFGHRCSERTMEARVKSGIWVSMALRLADIAGRSGVVLRRGDADSGGVLCILRGREGLTVLNQVRDAEGRPAWMRGTGAAPVSQDSVDAYVDRQLRYDPDLWVLEFETPDLVPPFEGRVI
jgi:hypothetical protein